MKTIVSDLVFSLLAFALLFCLLSLSTGTLNGSSSSALSHTTSSGWWELVGCSSCIIAALFVLWLAEGAKADPGTDKDSHRVCTAVIGCVSLILCVAWRGKEYGPLIITGLVASTYFLFYVAAPAVAMAVRAVYKRVVRDVPKAIL